MKKRKKMRAWFYADFYCDDMIDEEALKLQYKGSWTKCIKWLYEQDSIGIFDDLKFQMVTDIPDWNRI